nr:hypothetical protein [Pseudomonadota bacterium]
MNKNEDKQRRRTLTLGGGQCAFAGFGQGLVDCALLNHFNHLDPDMRFKPFLDLFAEQVGLPASWSVFIDYVKAHLNPPGDLQSLLARLLRKLLVRLREQRNQASEGELASLQAAFMDALRKFLNLPVHEGGFRGDDIYHRHAFVVAKFQALIAEYFSDFDKDDLKIALSPGNQLLTAEQAIVLDLYHNVLPVANLELLEWYGADGDRLFTRAMADEMQYAGDPELEMLARFWGVTFKVERTQAGRKFVHTINGDFGSVDMQLFTADEIRLLKNFRVVDPVEHEGRLTFLENDRNTLLLRLADIENAKALGVLWVSWQGGNRYLPKELRESIVVPEFWSEDLQKELLVRDILVMEKNQLFFPTEVSDKEFYLRLCPFKSEQDRVKILKLWNENYKPRPEIRCANDNAIHWEYLQPVGYPWEALVTVPPQVHVFDFVDSLGITFFGAANGALVEDFNLPDRPVRNELSWSPIMLHADDLTNDLLYGLSKWRDKERLFYHRICCILIEIARDGVISKEHAFLLLNPKKTFEQMHPGVTLYRDEHYANMVTFRSCFYLQILRSAYEQIITDLPAAEQAITSLILTATQKARDDYVAALQGYQKVCTAIV